MAYTPKNELTQDSRKHYKKFSEFEGTWQQYCAYLENNSLLSPNIINDFGFYRLRDGYNPNYTLKDFI